MEKEWPFLSNPIEVATRGNYSKYATISTDVTNALSGPNAFQTLYDYYNPQHLAYMNAYSIWNDQKGKQKGSTTTLTGLLKSLGGAAYRWAYQIEAVYPKGSAEYVAIFPSGRKPFYKGKQVDRIAAVAQLSIALTDITTLASVKAEVDTWNTNLTTANNAQKNQKTVKDSKSAILEAHRIDAAKAMYYVVAGLMQEFNDDPKRIADYIPLELIRNIQQKVYVGHLTIGALKVIFKRTFKPNAQITLKNNGLVPVEYYMAATKTGALPEGVTPVTVPADLATKVPVTALGSFANKFLTVRNTSETAEADWEVVL